MSFLWHVSMKNTFSKDKKNSDQMKKKDLCYLRGQTGYTIGNS